MPAVAGGTRGRLGRTRTIASLTTGPAAAGVSGCKPESPSERFSDSPRTPKTIASSAAPHGAGGRSIRPKWTMPSTPCRTPSPRRPISGNSGANSRPDCRDQRRRNPKHVGDHMDPRLVAGEFFSGPMSRIRFGSMTGTRIGAHVVTREDAVGAASDAARGGWTRGVFASAPNDAPSAGNVSDRGEPRSAEALWRWLPSLPGNKRGTTPCAGQKSTLSTLDKCPHGPMHLPFPEVVLLVRTTDRQI